MTSKYESEARGTIAERRCNMSFQKHHVLPRSRGGSSKGQNIVKVRKTPHEKYHSLFQNKTPPEIVKYLVDEFWGGQWHYVNNALAHASK